MPVPVVIAPHVQLLGRDDDEEETAVWTLELNPVAPPLLLLRLVDGGGVLSLGWRYPRFICCDPSFVSCFETSGERALERGLRTSTMSVGTMPTMIGNSHRMKLFADDYHGDEKE